MPEKVFFGNSWTSNNTTNSYILVKFPRPVIVNTVSFSATTTPMFIDYQIQGSNDGVTWNALTTVTVIVAGFQTFSSNNYTSYLYIKFYEIRSIPSGTGAGLDYLQYYGTVFNYNLNIYIINKCEKK